MFELESNQLLLHYADLRILSPGRVRGLVASMLRDGQRSPVVVVAGSVLVDGYHRVAALRELGRDLVNVVDLQMTEVEALLWSWRLERGRRRSALEEGWLLARLMESSDSSAAKLAEQMGRPRSWVSQRLGLVRVLPESVQEAVRAAKIPPQAAMKSLVPMARVDAASCAKLVAALPEPVTVRQMSRLYLAWKQADAMGKQRVVANPTLLLKAEDASASVPLDVEEQLARDLERLTSLCHRARRAVGDGLFARANTGVMWRAWEQANGAFSSLKEEVERVKP